MWTTDAPARAAAIASAAISSGVTGTCSLLPVVSPAPVTAHVRMTLRFMMTPRQSVDGSVVPGAMIARCT
ncbi:Uncharacterised protein [Mycobacteroides abscessus subsp. abscessus]|nr:Uncharacterised protein [Mycobacteroides abscessus subsp. abscessus]